MADLKLSAATKASDPLSGAVRLAASDAGVDRYVDPWQLYEFVTDKGADVASAGVLVLGDGHFFHITGTTTITDIDFSNTWNGRIARLVFDGSLTLTHNATTLVLPGGVNIQTGAGDSCTVIVDSGDNVRVTQYERAAQTQNSNPATAAIANQSPAASATTLITDSVISVPPSGVQIRSRFLWHVTMSKTNAGTVAVVLLVKMGTAGTTADGTILTFTFPSVGTAAADIADIWIEFVVVGPLTSSCVPRGILTMSRTLATTGWTTTAGPNNRIIGTAANFNATTANLKASLALTLGASYVVTIEQCTVETNNL